MKNSKLNQHSFMFDHYIEILVSLSLSLLSMNIAYIVFSLISWSTQEVLCVVFGALLHYFLICSFCWMLSLAILQYLMFVKVFVMVNKFYLKATLFSMGKQFKIFYGCNIFKAK